MTNTQPTFEKKHTIGFPGRSIKSYGWSPCEFSTPRRIMFQDEAKTGLAIPSTGRTRFKHSILEAVRSPHSSRKSHIELIARKLKYSRDNFEYVIQMLEICASEGGPDGLDVASDVISQLGEIGLNCARQYYRCTIRLVRTPKFDMHNSNIWFSLLKGVASSCAASEQIIEFLFILIRRGYPYHIYAALCTLPDLIDDKPKSYRQDVLSLLRKQVALNLKSFDDNLLIILNDTLKQIDCV